MFEITRCALGNFTSHRLHNTLTGEYVVILPESGGLVFQIGLAWKGTVYDLLESEPDERRLFKAESYYAAKLVPWPNRIRDGRYAFQGKKYQLPINEPARNNALHGLLYAKAMKVVKSEADANSAVLTLSYDFNGSDGGYPFRLKVRLTYRLDAKGFSCTTRARNLGEGPLPFADGWHPYFTFGGQIDRLRLELPARQFFQVDTQMIPTGKEQFDFDGSLSGREFDTGFVVSGEGKTRLIDPARNVTIVLWQDKSYPHLQVYTPESRKSIAIEPMSAATDAFNSGEDLTVLQPGEEFKGAYGVFLEKAV